MTDRNELWLADMDDNGWVMPPAPFWKTLPIIRHFRAAYYAYRVHENETFWGRLGMVPSGYDRWVLYGIRRGFDRHVDAGTMTNGPMTWGEAYQAFLALGYKEGFAVWLANCATGGDPNFRAAALADLAEADAPIVEKKEKL